MIMRTLGKTGVKVSRLAIGAMPFGGDADEKTAQDLWKTARDAGVNFLDTANVYSNGVSEQICGRLIKGCRNEIVLATKAYFPMGGDANARGTSRYHLVRAVEASLQRLQTDRIDLFYLHRFDDVTALDETLRAVEDLIRQGKILYPACSNFSAWQTAHALGMQRSANWAPLVAIQPMYNLVKRQAEVEILPMAESLGVGVVTYSPTGGGLLTGKYGSTDRPNSGRLVENKMYGTRYGDSGMYATAEAFTALANERGVAPATLSTSWVLAHRSVTSVLLGARNVAQLQETLAADKFTMDESTYAAIRALSPTPAPATDRNEEASSHNYGAR
jgi:aryl-alcohol dehydrogenase-like predicted oxidoreductase